MLRTDLVIEVQEYFVAGRLRVNVKRNGAYVPQAHVKVVGSGDKQFKSGDTDFRGVFVAEDLIGQATVIAKVGEDYAFHRGKNLFQPSRFQMPPQGDAQRRQSEGKQPTGGERFKALDNLFQNNDALQRSNLRYLQELYDNKQTGVQVDKTR
jgi:hypothetical protein